jgi:glycosyltransferase involved in cell wall biosynthesis
MSTGDQGAEAMAGSVTPAAPMTWALCVATLNRIDMLETCVTCALAQTRPPSEIVIVDASDTWQSHHQRIAAIAAPAGVPVVYIPAHRRSLPSQRNQGIAAASADILFLIDDDSLLYPDAAAEILRVYEAAPHGTVSAVGLSDRDDPPVAMSGSDAQKTDGGDNGAIGASLAGSSLVHWIKRHVLLLGTDVMFMPYIRSSQPRTEKDARALGLADVTFSPMIGGCALTARREVALREPFEGELLSYSPMEDLDTTYRYLFHGVNLFAGRAGFHHFTSAGARIRRQQVAQLTMMNMAFFVARNSKARLRDSARFGLYAVRRTLAELLKDLLKKRWDLPQFRGALAAVPATVQILARSAPDLAPWYVRRQSLLLWGKPVPTPGPGATLSASNGKNP